MYILKKIHWMQFLFYFYQILGIVEEVVEHLVKKFLGKLQDGYPADFQKGLLMELTRLVSVATN